MARKVRYRHGLCIWHCSDILLIDSYSILIGSTGSGARRGRLLLSKMLERMRCSLVRSKRHIVSRVGDRQELCIWEVSRNVLWLEKYLRTRKLGCDDRG